MFRKIVFTQCSWVPLYMHHPVIFSLAINNSIPKQITFRIATSTQASAMHVCHKRARISLPACKCSQHIIISEPSNYRCSYMYYIYTLYITYSLKTRKQHSLRIAKYTSGSWVAWCNDLRFEGWQWCNVEMDWIVEQRSRLLGSFWL